jgi:putative ABC transport system substrate-binding protein
MKSTSAALAVVLTLAFYYAPLAAQTRETPKLFRVGVLAGGGPNFDAGFEPFRQRLRELGYVEGRTISLVVRNAEGRNEHIAEHAADLVRVPADVIVVQGNPSLTALRKATQTIPIVMATIADPVGSGFVTSLARPGGNVTGLSNMTEGVSAKWVELVREVAPKATRLALLWNPQLAAHQSMWREIQRASGNLKMTPRTWEARTPEEIGRAFVEIGAERMDALIILPSPTVNVHRRQIAELAIKYRLPALYTYREFVDAGCLLSYGPSVADLWVRSADYVDKILKGAKPMDLPVAQPTTFVLALNLKTAKALGLTIPPSLLVRASEIVE